MIVMGFSDILRVCFVRAPDLPPQLNPVWSGRQPATATDRPSKNRLPHFRPTVMLDTMKTVTTREFFHAPALVKSLRPGQSLIVTDSGNPSFVVTKAGKRRVKSAEDMEQEAKQLFPGPRPRMNFTALIKKLKK
jgi:hypothetical protein